MRFFAGQDSTVGVHLEDGVTVQLRKYVGAYTLQQDSHAAPGRQRDRVRAHSPAGAVMTTNVFCRFCDGPVSATLLNEFLEHLSIAHSLRLYSVLLGERTLIRTNIGEVEVHLV